MYSFCVGCCSYACLLLALCSGVHYQVIIHVPLAPSAAPTPMRIGSTTSTITVRWGAVDCIDRNGNITGYSVRYGVQGTAEGDRTVKMATGDSSEGMYTISGLSAATVYTVEVAAVNSAGTGVYSDPITAATVGEDSNTCSCIILSLWVITCNSCTHTWSNIYCIGSVAALAGQVLVRPLFGLGSHALSIPHARSTAWLHKARCRHGPGQLLNYIANDCKLHMRKIRHVLWPDYFKIAGATPALG